MEEGGVLGVYMMVTWGITGDEPGRSLQYTSRHNSHPERIISTALRSKWVLSESRGIELVVFVSLQIVNIERHRNIDFVPGIFAISVLLRHKSAKRVNGFSGADTYLVGRFRLASSSFDPPANFIPAPRTSYVGKDEAAVDQNPTVQSLIAQPSVGELLLWIQYRHIIDLN
ncbi:uncharacterized protein N7511_000138 [Penicillium nucicola]|uniref:uncharacterized protein n=1 Tax=Penicillium nucicola TaxID=1850975 RepID=UPI00254589FF|nr:uncharacterized protein N7511_000138 [Penicillium nucicola]KAJ5775127.1 hypothetical protein N7511_000138 [Penicillium nucicola]